MIVTVYFAVIFFSKSVLYDVSCLKNASVSLSLHAAETTSYSPRKFLLLLRNTELLLGSTSRVKDYTSHTRLLPPRSRILVDPSDCSLRHVSNAFQDEIIEYQIHNPPQTGSVLSAAECCQCSREI